MIYLLANNAKYAFFFIHQQILTITLCHFIQDRLKYNEM